MVPTILDYGSVSVCEELMRKNVLIWKQMDLLKSALTQLIRISGNRMVST